jgi:hypothetical protein
MTGAGSVKMTRSHVLLHCPNEKLRAARTEAWEEKNPDMGTGGFTAVGRTALGRGDLRRGTHTPSLAHSAPLGGGFPLSLQ